MTEEKPPLVVAIGGVALYRDDQTEPSALLLTIDGEPLGIEYEPLEYREGWLS